MDNDLTRPANGSPAGIRQSSGQTGDIDLSDLLAPGVPIGRGLSWILGLAFALEACQLAGPMLAKIVVDRVIRSEDHSLLLPLAVAFSAVAAVQAMLGLARTKSLILFGERVNASWLSNLFSRLVSLPMSFFETRPVGHVAAKFWSVSYMQRVLTTSFVEGTLDGFMAVFGLALMLFIAPWTAAAGSAAIVTYAFVRWLHMPRQLDADKRRTEFSIVQQSTLWETIAGVQSVKLGLHHEHRRRRWLLGVQGMFDGDRHFQQSAATVRAVHTLLSVLERVMVVAIAGTEVRAGNLTLGAMVALLAYNELFVQRTAALVDKWSEYLLLDVHRKRIAELLAASPERNPNDGASVELSHANASVEAENLAIGYDISAPLATHIDLRIRAGECTVIMGPSGCGKTTLLRTLLGLSPELAGTIRVAGIDLRELRRSSLYGRLATVLREDRIFAGTVAENVAFGDEEADLARIEECCAAVDLHNEIAALPNRYETQIKDDGAILSAGQRQRILLARAFYRRPAVLVLDEATSNLDAKRERMVLDYLTRMRATRIVVTHREAHLSIADQVYEFKNGTILERRQGSDAIAAAEAKAR